jgi:hypothetical protein
MLEIETLLENYANGPGLLRNSFTGLTSTELDATPIPGKWSIRQVVCHIADFEPVNATRMKRIIAEDNPTLLGSDENHFAARLAYSQRDIEEDMVIIELTVSQMLKILKHCDIEDFQRTGVHSEAGPMTLEAMLERTINHIPHHVAFINEKRTALENQPSPGP